MMDAFSFLGRLRTAIENTLKIQYSMCVGRTIVDVFVLQFLHQVQLFQLFGEMCAGLRGSGLLDKLL